MIGGASTAHEARELAQNVKGIKEELKTVEIIMQNFDVLQEQVGQVGKL
jgi:hypothetical protein